MQNRTYLYNVIHLKNIENMITLHQLGLLQEIVKNAFSISAAALTCHTSQPGASRQVALLEQEFGVKLLLRRKNRILNLTAVGQEIRPPP